VFFFAMIFAISMDYTVSVLSSAKEHWDRSQDPHEAMVGAVASSGRVVFAVAVLLDAFLVRLLLVPVLLRLLGARAWWLPTPLARLLPTVRFAHA
jgi:RND superfamily putative drug exporter